MMNYLLYFVYNKDECIMVENSKKMLKDEQIKAMFSKLSKIIIYLMGPWKY